VLGQDQILTQPIGVMVGPGALLQPPAWPAAQPRSSGRFGSRQGSWGSAPGPAWPAAQLRATGGLSAAQRSRRVFFLLRKFLVKQADVEITEPPLAVGRFQRRRGT
jgi:hypothetical protein